MGSKKVTIATWVWMVVPFWSFDFYYTVNLLDIRVKLKVKFTVFFYCFFNYLLIEWKLVMVLSQET